MEGPAPPAGGGRGGVGSRSAVGSGPAAAADGGLANGNGAAASGLIVTFNRSFTVPVAARPWFLAQDSKGDKNSVKVYGRLPDGTVRSHNVKLNRRVDKWWLSDTVSLLNDLDVHKGDRVRLTREEVEVAAAGPGAAASGGGVGVVVEKVAGGQEQGQQHHRRRHARAAVRIDPPLDPSGPSAGRVVVSEDRRFADASVLKITVNAVLCLVDEACIEEARAAAANGGTTSKYLVTVYARRAGEDGPPVPFGRVSLTPSPAGHGTMTWCLGGLGPLRQHLGLAPRAPVRLVREVGQDGRVRLVVEPRGEEGEGGAGQAKGKRRAQRVEAEDSDTDEEDEEQGVLQGAGYSSCSSEEKDGSSGAAGGSDDDGESSNGEGTGSDNPDWAPGNGAGQGAVVRGRARQQQQPKAQQQQRQQQPTNQNQRRSPSQPQHRRPLQQQQTGPGDGVGGSSGENSGPGALWGRGPGAVEGPGGGVRQCKRRRLEVGTEQDDERPAGQHGGATEGGGTAYGGEGGEDVDSGADRLLAALKSSCAALAAAQARAAALERQLDRERERAETAERERDSEREGKEAAERQLGRERERAEAAEAKVRRSRQHMAGVLQQAGALVGGGPAAVRQPQPQPRAPGTPA